MSKNIEINYKEDSGYEVLYPTTIPDQVINLLTDFTKTYIGLDPSSTPDDAFRSLYLLNVLSDKASFRLTVKTAGGTPIANLPVTCNKYLDGNSNPVAGPLYTDENGVIDTFFANGNVTLSVTGYADLENWSQQYSVVNGEQYEEEAALTTRNFLKWTSSTTTKFSSNVSRVDVSCCGGGGGGGGAQGYSRGNVGTGGGGGGGYASMEEKVTFVINNNYSIIVGAAGVAGISRDSSTRKATDGGDGGNSSFLTIEAQGGKGGKAAVFNSSNDSISIGAGGEGNGKGGNGVLPSRNGNNGGSGQGNIYDSFATIKSVGGGGGSGSAYKEPNYKTGGNGGAPGGGKGGANAGDASAGVSGTGGGGGSGYGYVENSEYHPVRVMASMPGGSGCVAIRMHLKAT